MRQHLEHHYAEGTCWLRVALMGANNGITLTASLMVGVAAANTVHGNILIAGLAGLVAGAMSMAAGEYGSVRSQSDTEKTNRKQERQKLEGNEEFERRELADIYVNRGLDQEFALLVAGQLLRHDSLGAHARDELGLTKIHPAHPVQAAFASAATFAMGAAVPLLIAWLSPHLHLIPSVAGGSLLCLALMGALAARAGGARVAVGAGRVVLWGALSMATTAAVGAIWGAAA